MNTFAFLFSTPFSSANESFFHKKGISTYFYKVPFSENRF